MRHRPSWIAHAVLEIRFQENDFSSNNRLCTINAVRELLQNAAPNAPGESL